MSLAVASPSWRNTLDSVTLLWYFLIRLADVSRGEASAVRGGLFCFWGLPPSREASAGQAPATLIQVREFDRYQGKGVPEGKVSLSLRLTFQSPERTLTDDEVQAGMQRIIDALTRELQAVQR